MSRAEIKSGKKLICAAALFAAWNMPLTADTVPADAAVAAGVPPAAAPAPVSLKPDYPQDIVAEYIALSDAGNGKGLLELYGEYSAKNDDDLALLILAGAELRNGNPRTAVNKLEILTAADILPGESRQHRMLFARTLWELASAYLQINDFTRARETFDRLAVFGDDTYWQESARGGSIYAAIQGGEYTRAASMLANQETVRGRDELNTWLLFRTGAFNEFQSAYSKLCPAGETPEDLADIRREIALAAAAYYEKTAGNAAALSYWRDAFLLSTDENERMAAGRKIIDGEVDSGDTAAAVSTINRFIELFPEAPDRGNIMLRKARLCRELNVERSLRAYLTAAEDESIDFEIRQTAFAERALLLESLGRYSDSLSTCYALAGCAKGAEAEQYAALLTAGIHERAGNCDDALEYFRKAAAFDGRCNCAANCGIARNGVMLGRWETALSAAERATECKDTAGSASFAAEAWFRKGQSLAGLDRKAEALQAFLYTSAEYPQTSFGVDAAGMAGDMNMALGNFAGALENYDFAADLAGKDGRPEYKKTAEAMRLKAIDAAGSAVMPGDVKIQLEKLYQEFPASEFLLPAVLWYGDLLKNIGRVPEAAAEYAIWEERFEGDNIKTAAVCLESALAAEDTPAGRIEALAKIDKALLLAPDSEFTIAALFEKADIFSRSENYEDARRVCLEAISRISDDPQEDEQVLLALLVMRLGDNSFQLFQLLADKAMLEESISAYENVLASEFLPELFRPQAAYRLGKCFEESPTPGKALKIYEDLLLAAAVEYSARGVITGRDWVMLAGNAGINLCLQQKSSAVGMRALGLVENMTALNLPMDSNREELIQEIRRKFAL